MPTWTLELRDDLFGLQNPDDGSEYTASVFYVIATNERGERYAHDHRFISAHIERNDQESDGPYISSYREKALAQAEAFLEKVKAAQKAGKFTGPVDREHWNETNPVYGSDAYVGREEEIVHQERIESDEFEARYLAAW